MKSIMQVIILISIAGTGIGCASQSQKSVSMLAEKTAANIGVISNHMKRLASSNRAIAERRINNIAQLHAANTDLRARYLYDLELTKKAGDSQDLALMEEIKLWGKTVQNFRVDRATSAETRRQKLMAAQKTIETQSAALNGIAAALAALAEEEAEDRFKFMVGYMREVKKQLDARLEEDNETATRANALLNKVNE